MPDATSFLLFLAAALVLAVTPGPGILYVAARTLQDGLPIGIASSLGTGVGGFVHVIGGAIGVSALLLASAEAFTVLKFAGAFYLVWLGVTTFRRAGAPPPAGIGTTPPIATFGRAFRDGALVEALNPKTAIFFLAFIPQFVSTEPSGSAHFAITLPFMTLGALCVALNTLADLGVALMASRARLRLSGQATRLRRVRQGSGLAMCGLGIGLAALRRPA